MKTKRISLLVFLLLTLLLLAGCGAPSDLGGSPDETTDTDTTEAQDPEAGDPETEDTQDRASHVDEDGRIVWYLGKEGEETYKVVVDPKAAASTEYKYEDESAHSVWLYDLSRNADEPVWSMHMCLGKTPAGVIAAHENGGLYMWYNDFWEENSELWYTLVTYEVYVDPLGNLVKNQTSKLLQGAVGEDTEMWFELNRVGLIGGIIGIDDKLSDGGFFVLLDVSGDEVLYSTPDSRFSYSFDVPNNYQTFRTAYENIGTYKQIVPLED